MNTPRLKRPHLIQRRLCASAAALSLLTLAPLTGCAKHRGSDEPDHGTDHAAKPENHTEPDAHDHEPDDGADHSAGEEAHADEVRLSAGAVERYGVKVETARLRVLKPTVVTHARVAFNTEAMAHVGSPLRGRAVEIKVRLGDTVMAGQELVIVESPELGEAQADFLLKKSAVHTAGPAIDLAKVVWERAAGLFEQSQGISLTEVQRRESEYKVAIAAQKAAEAAATVSENRLHLLGMKQSEVSALASTGEIVPRYAIKAPIDGLVVQREITLGEIVSPDRESLMVLADTRTLWVLADVPEAGLMGIAAGATVWIRVGPSDAAPFEGRVAYISPTVDISTRTAQVRIEVATKDYPLKPGMFAQAEFVLTAPAGQSPAPVVAVPIEAIQTVEGGPAIFVPVPDEPNTFAKRSVTLGKSIGGLVPITAGLVEGERFVSAGTFILKAELGKGAAAHDH